MTLCTDGLEIAKTLHSGTISRLTLGPLINVIGDNGPRDLRIRKDTRVGEASVNGSWILPPERSPAAETIQLVLAGTDPPPLDSGRDRFLWRKAVGSFGSHFSPPRSLGSI